MQFVRSHEVKSQHLEQLQQQTERSTSELLALQDQAAKMQKSFAAHQRRVMRQRESQQVLDATQRTWAAERRELVEAADRAAAAVREATAREHQITLEHAARTREIDAEREHALLALRRQREGAALTEGALRDELRGLRALYETLVADHTRVTLRNGASMPLSKYVLTLAEGRAQQIARRSQQRSRLPRQEAAESAPKPSTAARSESNHATSEATRRRAPSSYL